MKKISSIIFFLMLSFSAWGKPFIYGGYGLSSFNDAKKSDIGMNISQTPMKLGLGQRYGHLEFELQYRMANGESEFEHDGVKNTLEHKSSSLMAGIGIYTIPALRLHGGIAFHTVEETIAKDVTSTQEASIQDEYGVHDDTGLGSYVGVDLHLITIWKAKLTLSGTAYFFPSFESGKEYEGMLGIKIPFGGGGRSSSFNPLRSMSDR